MPHGRLHGSERPPASRQAWLWSESAGSVDVAGGNDPLGGLAGDRGDPIEVRVVVEDREATQFGCRGDQEVRHLATPLMFGSQQPLNLSRAGDVFAGDFDQRKQIQCARELIPFLGATGGVADLKIADSGSGQLAALSSRFDLGVAPVAGRLNARICW